MFLACHKKRYLICDKVMNFRIFTQRIPIFFSKHKTETAKTGQRQLLILHNILKICNFVAYQITFFITWLGTLRRKSWTLNCTTRPTLKFCRIKIAHHRTFIKRTLVVKCSKCFLFEIIVCFWINDTKFITK